MRRARLVNGLSPRFKKRKEERRDEEEEGINVVSPNAFVAASVDENALGDNNKKINKKDVKERQFNALTRRRDARR